MLPKVKQSLDFALEGYMLCFFVSIHKCTCLRPRSKDARCPSLGNNVVSLGVANSSTAIVWYFLILHERRREDDLTMDYPSGAIHYCTSTINSGPNWLVQSTIIVVIYQWWPYFWRWWILVSLDVGVSQTGGSLQLGMQKANTSH